MFENIFGQLGFKKRTHVGVAVSVNNLVELVCVDDVTGKVVRYKSGNVKYNNAIREIMDFDEFSDVIEGMFSEAGLKPSECAVTLSLPNVHFGITSVEANYEKPYLEENIQTEIEDLYIFKRSEPAIAYSELVASRARNQVNVAYSAMQSVILGRIIEVFDSMQAELVSIDNSYSSLLKTLQYCEPFSRFFEKDSRTAIVLITPGNCAAFSMRGNELLDFDEEAIATKSLSTEEVYSTIEKIASGVISKNSPKSLIVISEADEVNAEQLTNSLNFNGETLPFNRSIRLSDEFIKVNELVHDDIDSNMLSYLTLEAVGAAIADYREYPLDINFIPIERRNPNIIKVFGYEIDMVKFIIIAILSAVLAGGALGLSIRSILGFQADTYKRNADKAETDVGVFKKRVNDGKNGIKKTVFPQLKKIVDNNNTVVDTYKLLSTEIPDGVYVKRFVSNSNSGMLILGEAKSADIASEFATKLREHNHDLLFSGVSVNSNQDLFASTFGGKNSGVNFELKTAGFDADSKNLQSTLENINNDAKSNDNKQNADSVQQNYNNDFMAPPPPVI